jgi:hypothetical protein
MQSRDAKKKGQQSKTARAIVNPDALESLKRRAEDLGLIVHARQPSKPAQERGQKKREKE